MLSPYQRALIEIELLSDFNIRMTNGLIDYSKLIPKIIAKIERGQTEKNIIPPVVTGNPFERFGVKKLDNQKIREMKQWYGS